MLESRTDAEARFEVGRRRAGQILAPLVFMGMVALPLPGLTQEGHGLAAITAMTVILWITEAIPLAAAAVLAPSLAVVMGVTDATAAFAPLASPLIFLFMGGFMLALGLAEQGLDRRAALWLLGRRWISGSPARASASIAVSTYLISMWISNTATTAMMIPVALGLSRTIRAAAPEVDRPRFDRHAEGMLLGLTYAASLGGIATPVGTAPNVIALGMVESQLHLRIDFFQWMSFALPTSALTLGVVLLYGAWRFPSPVARLDALADNVEAIEFNYILANGSTTLSPSTSDLNEIRSVQVSLLARTSNPTPDFVHNASYTTASGAVWTPPQDNFRRRLILTTIHCRNLGY